MYDVAVIGGGLAGVTAALAARAQGAQVLLASRSWGATALSTGAIDIAYTPALSGKRQETRPIIDHIRDIIEHRHRHPYGVLGLERTVEGLRSGYAMVADQLRHIQLFPGLDLERPNAVFVSSLGTLLPAAGGTPAHEPFNLRTAEGARWGIVQWVRDSYFHASSVLAGAEKDASKSLTAKPKLAVVNIEYPAAESPFVTARQLDTREEQERLAGAVRDALARENVDGLLFPPALGLTRASEVRQFLHEATGVPVGETLAHMPSVPGFRLQKALDTVLDDSGIARIGEVIGFSEKAGAIETLRTDDQLDIAIGSVVLATGRFVADGVGWKADATETLFGLPLATELGRMEEDSPLSVVREDPVESHPLMTAGVAVNEQLQPLREGEVAHKNLWAAGMVIGGFASRYSLCADGVALSTGWWAGRNAATASGASG